MRMKKNLKDLEEFQWSIRNYKIQNFKCRRRQLLGEKAPENRHGISYLECQLDNAYGAPENALLLEKSSAVIVNLSVKSAASDKPGK